MFCGWTFISFFLNPLLFFINFSRLFLSILHHKNFPRPPCSNFVSVLRLIFRTWHFDCGNSDSVENADSSDSFPIRWLSMDDVSVHQCSRVKMNVRPCSVSGVYSRSCIVPFDHDLVWGIWEKKNSIQNFSFFSATSWRKLNKSSSNRFGLTKIPFSAFLFLNYGDQLGS